jgi:H+-translocating NAD(P) transhydrogenase subunit alpha
MAVAARSAYASVRDVKKGEAATMPSKFIGGLLILLLVVAPAAAQHQPATTTQAAASGGERLDFVAMLYVFMLATFIGIGVIRRVSRLLHTPLMSLTNAISAIAVVGSIMVAGGMREYPIAIRLLGAIALFCSMTNIVSGFLITDRMLKMFKTRPTPGGKP